MSAIRVTKLDDREHGYWTANVTHRGHTYACDRKHGSWMTLGCHLVPWAAEYLQERVRKIERQRRRAA